MISTNFVKPLTKLVFQNVFNAKQTEYLSSMESEDSCKRETIWLERDLIVPLAGTNTAYLYQTTNWWSQIKTAGSAIYANRHYLALYNKTNNERLTKEVKSNLALWRNTLLFIFQDKNTPKIIGDVFIHESATVDPSAVLGPNVSIGKNVKIGAGARIRESIILGEYDFKCLVHHVSILNFLRQLSHRREHARPLQCHWMELICWKLEQSRRDSR